MNAKQEWIDARAACADWRMRLDDAIDRDAPTHELTALRVECDVVEARFHAAYEARTRDIARGLAINSAVAIVTFAVLTVAIVALAAR